MRLTDTALYLDLVRGAFERDILPELQSSAAKGSAGLIATVLGELARREQALPNVLEAINREGCALADALSAALSRPPHAHPAGGQGNFTHLAATYDALCTRIAADAAALSEREGRDDAAQHLLRRAAEWEGNAHMALVATPAPAIARAVDADPLPREALQTFLQGVHPARGKLRVISLSRIPGGFGKQTYMAQIDDGQATSLVIRKADAKPALTHPVFDLKREFMLLQAVHAAGYPVPKPLWFGRDVAGIDADFMVVEKVPGHVIGAFLDGADHLPESQMLQLAELLARLHAIPLDRFNALITRFDSPTLLTDSVEQYTRHTMQGWRDYAQGCGHLASPLIDYALRWLVDNVPRDVRRPVLAHGDFGIHNLLSENDRVTAVLDWEGAMFSAPELDLIYARPMVSRHIAWDKFLAHYIACGGREPVEATMNYYMTFLAVRVVLSGNLAMRNLQSRVTGDIRFAMFELGLNPEFMRQALAATAPASISHDA